MIICNSKSRTQIEMYLCNKVTNKYKLNQIQQQEENNNAVNCLTTHRIHIINFISKMSVSLNR